jgi:hypothetical protein
MWCKTEGYDNIAGQHEKKMNLPDSVLRCTRTRSKPGARFGSSHARPSERRCIMETLYMI